MKITSTWLESRKEARNRPQERYEKTVDGHEGLMVRVHPSGAVSFVYRYTLPGSADRRYLVLGKFGPGLSLADAFEEHQGAQRELGRGLDPARERQKRLDAQQRAREEREGTGTVADLVEQFVHRKLRAERWDKETGTWVRDEKTTTRARKRPDEAGAILGHVDPAKQTKRKGKHPVETLVSRHGKLNARDVTKRQLLNLLEEMVDRGAPVSANRAYALLNQMFTWAAAKDIIPASPMAGIDRPGGEEIPRERVLNADEIKAFWTNVDKTEVEMAPATRLALKLLLVTAQRRGELTFAKWSHFDLDRKLWTIPVELLKSSHTRRSKPEPHAVPLSSLAIEILQQIKALTGDGTYVLPAHADKKKDRPYSERVLSRAVRENAKELGIAHWTPHDLRRTAASCMTKIGVPRLHVEKVLNHSTGDIAEVYDRHDYLPEKRVALERWAAHLREIIAGEDKKVIPFARSA